MVQNRFSSDDPYIMAAVISTARSKSNQADLNVVIQEQDFLRSTSATQQQTGLTSTVTNPVPNVTNVAIQTVYNSENPPPEQPPCFLGITQITLVNGYKSIRDVSVQQDYTMSFDAETGKRESDQVIGKWEHWVDSFMLVEFEDGHTTGVDKEGSHKYWNQGLYVPIRDLEIVWHWDNEWKPRKVVERRVINEPTMLYNLTTARLHNYQANGDAVSNTKSLNQD